MYCGVHKHAKMVLPGPQQRACPEYSPVPAILCLRTDAYGRVQVNTHQKRCLEEGCKTFPNYNFPGKSPAFCMTHALPGMVKPAPPPAGRCAWPSQPCELLVGADPHEGVRWEDLPGRRGAEPSCRNQLLHGAHIRTPLWVCRRTS